MVNGLPGMALDGEHDGMLLDYLDIEKKFLKTIRHGSDAFSKSPSFNLKELYCSIQRWFLLHTGRDCSSTSIHGFKEIRYTSREILDFIMRVFPNSFIIFNYRRDFTDNADNPEQRHMFVNVKKEEQSKHEMAGWTFNNTEKAFELPLEDFSLPLFANMSKFLGFPNCTPIKLTHLNANHTYTRKRRHGYDMESWNCSSVDSHDVEV
jgi:hypothetical protein